MITLQLSPLGDPATWGALQPCPPRALFLKALVPPTQRSLRYGLLSPYSAAPAGAQTFSLKHSEHVRVEVVHDGQAEEVATNGKQRWPLSPSTTLRLTMSQASPEASSDKVPWAGQRSCAGLGAGGQAGIWTGRICAGRKSRAWAIHVGFSFLTTTLKEQKERPPRWSSSWDSTRSLQGSWA